MSTFAKNGDLKSDSRCHYRANFCPHLSLRKVRPVMQSKYSLTGKKLKQSFVHHNTRPGTAFFPG